MQFCNPTRSMQPQEFGYCKGQYYYGHSRYRWRTWFRFNSRNWVCERQPFTVTRHDSSVVRQMLRFGPGPAGTREACGPFSSCGGKQHLREGGKQQLKVSAESCVRRVVHVQLHFLGQNVLDVVGLKLWLRDLWQDILFVPEIDRRGPSHAGSNREKVSKLTAVPQQTPHVRPGPNNGHVAADYVP